MKHSALLDQVPVETKRKAKRVDQPLLDPKNPGRAFFQAEIESNRRKERKLVWQALIAMAGVAVLVTVRLVFFP